MASLKKRLQNTILHKEPLDESNQLQNTPQGPIILFQNGLLQHQGVDYSLLGSQITWIEEPLQTDISYVYYMINKEVINQNLGILNIPEEIVKAELELERFEKLTRLKQYKEKQYQRLKLELESTESIVPESIVLESIIPEEKMKKYQERINHANIEKIEKIKSTKEIEEMISDEKNKKYQERISRSKIE